jgi:ribosomal protein S18 acetylase RimI-like enzyme
MPSVVFREATPADVPRLAALRRPDEAGGAAPERMQRYLAGEHHPRRALAPRTMWLALDGDAPVGYAAGHLTRRFGCDGELQWIYVSGDRRGRGIAAELLRRIAAWFVAHDARRVCVDVGNDRARAFYRRHGAVDLEAHWMVWDDVGEILAT